MTATPPLVADDWCLIPCLCSAHYDPTGRISLV